MLESYPPRRFNSLELIVCRLSTEPYRKHKSYLLSLKTFRSFKWFLRHGFYPARVRKSMALKISVSAAD